MFIIYKLGENQMKALLCLMLLGSLAAQNLHDNLSQPPKAKTQFSLFYEDIDGYSNLNLRGSVLVQFKVNTKGEVTQPEIIDTFNDYLNETIIDKVLAIEDRHFGALAGQGMVQTKLKNYEKALESYIEVHKIYPAMKSPIIMMQELQELIHKESI